MDGIGDGHLLVISDHGFRMYPGTVFLNRVLEREGLMVRSFALSKGSEKTSSGPRALLARFVKLPFIFPIARALYRAYLKLAGGGKGAAKASLEEGIDYNRSSCYTPTTESMGVYITEAGKDGREGIASFLSGLEHDGKRVFDRVIPREEIYSGPHLVSAPDLLLHSDDFMISANIFGNELFGEGTAYHDMNAVFFLYGRDIRPGELTIAPRLVDVAPTVLMLFGVKGGEDMDGHAVAGAFIERPKEGSSELERIRKAALRFKGKGLNRGSQAPGASP
jgi:predicted AlkP superfamily phosphohydrolase/phosphomutase